jgi:hypothetical protein
MITVSYDDCSHFEFLSDECCMENLRLNFSLVWNLLDWTTSMRTKYRSSSRTINCPLLFWYYLVCPLLRNVAACYWATEVLLLTALPWECVYWSVVWKWTFTPAPLFRLSGVMSQYASFKLSQVQMFQTWWSEDSADLDLWGSGGGTRKFHYPSCVWYDFHENFIIFPPACILNLILSENVPYFIIKSNKMAENSSKALFQVQVVRRTLRKIRQHYAGVRWME